MELVPYLEKNLNPRVTRNPFAGSVHLAREAWSFIEAEAKESGKAVLQGRWRDFTEAGWFRNAASRALQKQVLRQALKECLGSLRGHHFPACRRPCVALRRGTQRRSDPDFPGVHGHPAIRYAAVDQAVRFSGSRRLRTGLKYPANAGLLKPASFSGPKSADTPDLKTIRGKSLDSRIPRSAHRCRSLSPSVRRSRGTAMAVRATGR